MRRSPLLLLCVLLIFGGSCATGARAQEGIHWGKYPGWPNHEALYVNGQLAGGWNYHEARYYPWLGACWGQPCQPPVAAPARNFGLGLDGLRQDAFFSDRELTTINGREITLDHARRVLIESSGAPTLPDDRKQPFWVVVGSDADCQRAALLLTREPFKGTGRVQLYRPDDAMVRDRDGKVMYKPGVTLVSAGGRVLGHSDSFDAAEDLQEGLRRLDPKVDPAKFPSLKDRAVNAAIGPLIPHVALLGGGALLLAGAGIVHLTRRGEK